ncbi:MAG: hypothetical protein KJN71_09350 [Acidimicrobiia bacterium]|nr:hypothetical protein [Acidimicrobiia bacterium]
MIQFGLPTNGSHVNVADLHPELRDRLRVWSLDSDLPWKIRSGARTFSHQLSLYRNWVADGRPSHRPVANPSYRWPDGRMGSGHQIQPAGGYRHGNLPNDRPWAYAVDLMWRSGSPTAQEKAQLQAEGLLYGLDANVPGEWWHFTPVKIWSAPDPDPEPPTGPPMAEITQREWSRFKKTVNQSKHRINQLESRVEALERDEAPVERIRPLIRSEMKRLFDKMWH